MAKALKRLGIVFGLLFGLLAAGLVAVVLLVDPNDYREEITRAIEQRTGYVLTVDGGIELSLYPPLGLELTQSRVESTLGPERQPLLTIDQLRIGVAALPLLNRQLVVDRLDLSGVRVHLERGADGRSNWTVETAGATASAPPGSGQDDSAPAQPTPAATAVETAGAASAFSLERIGGVRVSDLTIVYRDEPGNQQHQAGPLQIEIGEVAPGQAVGIRLSGPALLEGGRSADLSLDADVTPSTDLSTVDLAIRQLAMDLNNPELPGMTTRALVSATGRWDRSASRIELPDLTLELDDTRLAGNASLESGNPTRLKFELLGDRFDADPYLAAFRQASEPAADGPEPDVQAQVASDETPETGTDAAPAQATESTTGTPRPVAAGVDDPVGARIRTLASSLELDARLGLDELRGHGLQFDDLDVQLKMNAGMIALERIALALGEGRAVGDLRIDLDESGYGIRTEHRLETIAIEPLANAFGQDGRLAGTVDGTVQLSARADTWTGLEEALEGRVAVAIADPRIDQRSADGELQIEAVVAGGSDRIDLTAQGEGLLLRMEELGDEPLTAAITMAGQLDRERDQLRLDRVALEGEGLTIDAEGNLNTLTTMPEFVGSTNLRSEQPRPWLDRFAPGVSAALAEDQPRSVTFTADVQASGQRVALSTLQLQMDESTLTGSVTAVLEGDKALDFGLQLDRLDLDALLAAAPGIPSGNDELVARATHPAAGHRFVLPVSVETPTAAEVSGLEALRDWRVDGTLAIDALDISGARIERLALPVSGRDGQYLADPVSASIYGGTLDAALALDVRPDTPEWAMRGQLTDVRTGALLQALFGRQLLVGPGRADADLRARGLTAETLLESLSGEVSVAVVDGALLGVNIAQILREAEARLRDRDPVAAAAPRQTDFSDLTGLIRLDAGIANIETLTARSPLLELEGSGQADLVARTIELGLGLRVLQRLERADGSPMTDLRGLTVPMRVSGPFAEPVIRLDLERLLREQLQQELEDELRERASEELQRFLRRL